MVEAGEGGLMSRLRLRRLRDPELSQTKEPRRGGRGRGKQWQKRGKVGLGLCLGT
jgi:hypothetical protein